MTFGLEFVLQCKHKDWEAGIYKVIDNCKIVSTDLKYYEIFGNFNFKLKYYFN